MDYSKRIIVTKGIGSETNKTIQKSLLVVLLQKDRALFALGLDESQRRSRPRVKLEAKASRKAGFPIQRALRLRILRLLLHLHLLVPLEQVSAMKRTSRKQWKRGRKVLLLYPPLRSIASARLLKNRIVKTGYISFRCITLYSMAYLENG